jgi:hypothetical protein
LLTIIVLAKVELGKDDEGGETTEDDDIKLTTKKLTVDIKSNNTIVSQGKFY